MAEDVKEVTEVESSATPPPSNTEVLANLTTEQYDNWKKTGNLPEPEESATSKSADGDDKSKTQKTAPVSEAGKDKSKQNAETRKTQLNKEIQELLDVRKKTAAEVAELEAKKVELAKVEKTEEKKKEESSASDGLSKENLKKMAADFRKRNEGGEFESYEELITALSTSILEEHGKLSEAKLKKLVSEGVAEFEKTWEEKQVKAQTTAQIQKANQEFEKEWRAKVDVATEKHPDYVELCFSKESPAAKIKTGSALDKAIFKSDQGAELLYHVCSNPEEIDRLQELDEFDSAQEIFKILLSFNPDNSVKAPAPKTTNSKKPPTIVAARGTTPDDPGEKALKERDYATYAAAENAKERAIRLKKPTA